VQAENDGKPVEHSTKRPDKHPGRQELPPNLPRVERILPCTPAQRVCKRCGKETVVIGYEESSQLDVEPAKYFVLVTRREKRACRSCEELGVVSARLPPRIIEKSLASDRIVIDTVVGKYCNHTPLHRQSVILERDIGLEISRATLDGWVLKVVGGAQRSPHRFPLPVFMRQAWIPLGKPRTPCAHYLHRRLWNLS
jgi:transposase